MRPSGLVVKAHRRFLDDTARLPPPVARKVSDVVRILRDKGAYYPRLETRKIAGQADDRFRFMDVDDSYRIVAAMEGRHVFLERVGPHDPTERWGETATLREYEERIAIDPSSVLRERRQVDRTGGQAMFELRPSLAELSASGAVSDLLTDCLDGVLDGWSDGAIEDWMIFLSPVQRRAVERTIDGPSRITGGPGTGKTVVGLHRAAAFARDAAEGRILLTSYVRSVPDVLGGLFERLAPELAPRVETRSLFSLAVGRLGPDIRGRIDPAGARRRFVARLHADPLRLRQLRMAGALSEDYLWDEVTRVIEGRGVASREAYLGLERHGRKRPLPAPVRSRLWDLYEEYRVACDDGPEPVLDWDRVLGLALDRVRSDPPVERYAAIVVDEAQDISEVGVRFLAQLLEGGMDGRLMLIGDNGQRIYPGGYRLSDVGLEVRGRSFVLSVCYRSTDEIMQAVGSLGQLISTDEFGEDGARGVLTSTVRTGPRPRVHAFADEAEETEWIAGELDPDDPRVDAVGILVPTNPAVAAWRRRLAEGGLGSVNLEEYHGRPMPGVKVGTYHRAKGLEFSRVFLPGLDWDHPRCDRADRDEMTEQAAAFYVAMSRARDELDVTYIRRPSLFVEAIRDACECLDHGADGAGDPESSDASDDLGSIGRS